MVFGSLLIAPDPSLFDYNVVPLLKNQFALITF